MPSATLLYAIRLGLLLMIMVVAVAAGRPAQARGSAHGHHGAAHRHAGAHFSRLPANVPAQHYCAASGRSVRDARDCPQAVAPPPAEDASSAIEHDGRQ